MIPYELQHITLTHVEIFFCCAETRNFTRAAKSLNITPGMVSKKISALETALGFSLFSREKNRVMLTPEGEALYAAWRAPMETVTRAVADIRSRSSHGETVSLVIWASTNLERFFVPLLSACSTDMEMSFRITLNDDQDIPEALAAGNYDVAIVPKFTETVLNQRKELESFLALPSPLYAALSPDNPLSGKQKLRVEDLQGLYLLHVEEAKTGYNDMLRELCLKHGFSPRFKIRDPDEFRTNYLFLDSDSVLITDKYYYAFSSNAAEYRELENTESGLLIAYRKDAPSHVRQFVEYARVFYKELR